MTNTVIISTRNLVDTISTFNIQKIQ